MKKQDDLGRYLFHQGTNSHAYEYLGCHVRRMKNGCSYTFRVWAPGAREVYLVGDGFGWETGVPLSRIPDSGVWEKELRAPQSLIGSAYKFRVVSSAGTAYKGDPYAFASEGGAGGASYITEASAFPWNDAGWLSHRKKTVRSENGRFLPHPVNIYEVHLGSFRRREDGSYATYRELADELAVYVKEMGYTHVELLPVAEHPFDGSWGYQVGAFYAPTSRFGSPDDFRYFVDRLHTSGIGVILDWVPAHFPKDEWGLFEFDGAPLYEYQGRDRMESANWGTRFFDVGREEVQSFLISNAMYWLREFHVDGLRVDAVAAMLYLDFDRKPGEWFPNPDGSNRNREAMAFFRKLNGTVLGEMPDVMMIAEESTDWPGVTHPVDGGEDNLGFTMKWNMGFANDLYRYLGTDPVFRKYHHSALNFPLMYAFRENYVLPISHDEVVHGKKSFLDKCAGTREEKFAQMRAALLLIMTYPGKKMLFMGTEYAPFREWDYANELEWFMLRYDDHRHMREYVAALNRFYLASPELWEQDFDPDGFVWILADENERNLVAYRRRSIGGAELIAVISFSGEENRNVLLPVEKGNYRVVFHTGNGKTAERYRAARRGKRYLLSVTLPPFGGILLRCEAPVIRVPVPEKRNKTQEEA